MAVSVTTQGGKAASLTAISTGSADPVFAMLVVDTHDFATDPLFVDSISGDEIAATSYARVAVTFQAPALQPDGRVIQVIDDTSFGIIGGALNATAGGAYLYANTGDDATSTIYVAVPFEPAVTTDGTTFTVRWPPETLTAS